MAGSVWVGRDVEEVSKMRVETRKIFKQDSRARGFMVKVFLF
jgi:hypothetical protein